MGYINQPGKINENTWLIDAVMKNTEGNRVHNGYAAYLIKTEDDVNCLINAGARTGAESIYKRLKSLRAWPPNRFSLSTRAVLKPCSAKYKALTIPATPPPTTKPL